MRLSNYSMFIDSVMWEYITCALHIYYVEKYMQKTVTKTKHIPTDASKNKVE